MSEELALDTKAYIAKALKVAQESHSPTGWCHREPKQWAKVAHHIIHGDTSAHSFIKSKECTRNFYYDTKAELLADPECQAIRNAWAAEISAIQFQGIDTFRASQNQYSEAVESGDVKIDGNELFKQAKALQGFNDIHGKLTGNNIQKISVEHVVTAEEYDNKKEEIRARIAAAKQAKEVDSEPELLDD